MFELTDRRALVTGAASGIGAAIARSYAAAGARLVLADRDSERLAQVAAECRALGAVVTETVADVGQPEGAWAGVDACVAAHGGIDILVNNAGMLTQGPCIELTLAQWNDMLRVDLTSVFLASQRALPHMQAQRWGRIINVASQLGIKGGAELCHYAAAKAGVIGFTKSLALEVARKGVTVNTVSPGYLATRMVQAVPQEVMQEKILPQIPIGRLGEPEEIGALIAFICSDAAGFMTGSNVAMNGGQHMY